MEVGTAFVSLLPSLKGFGAKTSSQIDPEAQSAGKSGGLKLGGAMIAAFGALGIGAFVGKSISDGLDVQAGTSKLTAQLGLTKAQSAKIGKSAGSLFGDGFGTGMDQVQEAVGSVIKNIDGMRGASESTLSRISGKVLNTANIFDQDLGGVTRAVSQLMRTGLAKSADQALDIITKGFQGGADKSEDFLDTLNEYGTQFRKMGLSGATATGIISQGLKAGARDGDLVADAIKEFSIRAVDGSKTSAAGFSALGLSAGKMTAQIAKGGPAAQKGLDTVLDRLRKVKDPAKQAQVATALFGTQAEDLGKALFAIDPSSATKSLGKVAGAADAAGKAFNDNAKAKITTFFRGLQVGATNVVGGYLLPALEKLGPLFKGLGAILGKVGKAFGFLFDSKNADGAQGFAEVLDNLLGNTGKLVAPLRAAGNAVRSMLAGLAGGGASGFLTTIKSIGSSIAANFLPVLRAAATMFGTVVLPALTRFGAYLAANLFPILQRIGNVIATQVVPVIATFARFIYGSLIPAVAKIVSQIAGSLRPVFDALFQQIQTTVLPVVAKLLSKFREWMPTIQKVIVIVLKVVGVVLRLAAAILGKVLPPLIRFAGFLIRNVVGAVVAVIGIIVKVVGAIIKFGAAVIAGGKKVAAFAGVVRGKIGDVAGFFHSLPGKIKNAFGNAGTLLLNIGRDIVNGLINGIRNVAHKVQDAALALVKKIPGPIRKAMGIASPSKVTHEIGQHIGQGLVNGIKSREKALRKQINSTISQMKSFKSAAAGIASTVADQFRGDLFTGGLDQLRTQLYADLNNAQAFTAAIKAATKKGLSGGLLRSIAQSGNVQVAEELAALSKTKIGQYENLFNARENAAKIAGNTAGQSIYGKAIAEQTRELRGLRSDLRQVLSRERSITVNDRSGNPKRTAKETARRLAFGG